ncbi:hypothetical protein [Natronomonas sp. EA1]|uniref:hypothetical protein n=1 Tax=Natronomonas sp. EA1 TaxID=3421655 RepID=UPI003EC06D11
MTSSPASNGSADAVAFPTGVVRYARERHEEAGESTDVFAVGLPTTALKSLVVSLAVTSSMGPIAVGGDALRPDGTPLGRPIRLRVLGRRETVLAALDDVNVASAAGVLYRQFRELGGGVAEANGAGTDSPATPATSPGGDEPPDAVTIRSATRAAADARPAELANVRVAPTDRSDRVFGHLTNWPGDLSGLDRAPAAPARPVTDPTLLFVDDVAFAVVPAVAGLGPSTDTATEAGTATTGGPFGDLAEETRAFPTGGWAAVPVAEGEPVHRLRAQYETGWDACTPVTLDTPPLDTVLSTVEETLGAAYARAFVVALGSATVTAEGSRAVASRAANPESDRPVLDDKHLVVLVGGYTGARRKDIATTMDECGFVSSSTMQRGLAELQRVDVVDTEPIETGTRGRNPHRLVLADDALRGLSMAELLDAAASRLAE